MSSFEIKKISVHDALELRQQVLKPHLKVAECILPGDLDETAMHFGLFDKDKIISIATFIQEGHPDFQANYPYRLRGMATSPNYQGQGCGSQLLLAAVAEVMKTHCDLIWFNAREVAFSFYTKLGFEFHGDYFDVPQGPGIKIPHKVMYKKLVPS